MRTQTRSKKRTSKKANWAMRILLVAVAAFLFLKLVQLHVQMEEKQNQWIDLNNSINRQMLIIEDLAEQTENAEAIQERKANDTGLYQPGQQIYQEAAG